MADEKKPIEKKPKAKKKGKVDLATIIFFIIMVIGLIVLTVIFLTKPTSKIYSTKYGDKFTVSVEMYSNNKIDLAIDVDEDRVIQSGTYKEDTSSSTSSTYIAEFIDEDTKEKTNINISIKDDTLTLTYSDGTEIILKEIKND